MSTNLWPPEENVIAAHEWNKSQLQWLIEDIKKRQASIKCFEPMGSDAADLLDTFVDQIVDLLKEY